MSTAYLHTEAIHNLTAPRVVVPLLMEMKRPKSVLDVGCGTGTWLKVFEEHGIEEYLGVDGEDLDKALLKIPAARFLGKDLRAPVSLGRKFDLVICLEVAEHVGEQYADQLVQTLVGHGEVILFSAAIPGQGGQGHVNEQWPAYWQHKFELHGYFFHDTIRPLIWGNPQVEWWYQQNVFMVTREKGPSKQLSLVHPDLYSLAVSRHEQYQESLTSGKQGLWTSARILVNALFFKLRSLVGFK